MVVVFSQRFKKGAFSHLSATYDPKAYVDAIQGFLFVIVFENALGTKRTTTLGSFLVRVCVVVCVRVNGF